MEKKLYAGGPSFDEMVKTFCKAEQKRLLRKAYDFSFDRNIKYGYDNDILDTLEKVIHDRARELAHMLDKS